MKISDEVIVLTSGWNTYDFVTEYRISDGKETNHTSLRQRRYDHACGVYLDEDGQQILLVTGGYNSGTLSSTEVATYSSGSRLSWRETAGYLPTPRTGLRGAVVNNIIY